MKKTISFFLFIAVFSSVFAQKYTTKSKRAIKKYEEAQEYYRVRDLENSLLIVIEAIDKDPLFVEAHMMKGAIHYDQKDYQKAIRSYKTAIGIDRDFFPPNHLQLAKLYFEVQDYERALLTAQNYVDRYNPPVSLSSKAYRVINNSKFAREAIKNPVPFKLLNLGSSINTDQEEYNPFLSVDQETFTFTRTVKDSRVISGLQEDFYYSTKKDTTWQMARPFGEPINSVVNEGALTLSPDGRFMIFTICEVYGNYGPGRKGLGSCDLFYSRRMSGGLWTKPQNLGPQINSSRFDSQPSVSSDGKEIYYSSARKGGKGESDIYVVKVSDAGFSNPINLGDVINTSGHEEGVFIHPDNKTLFFSSNGHPGMGGRDLYMSRRNEDGSWGKPQNLGYPINTGQDEWSIFIDAGSEWAYYTSDKEGGFGGADIYKFVVPPSIKPIPVTFMKGNVYDAQSKKPMGATFELLDIETGELVIESYSDKNTGQFLVSLPMGKEYALNVRSKGYLFYSDNFKLSDLSKGADAFLKDVPMSPIASNDGGGVVLKNVFFKTDSYELETKSKVELDKLVEFLEKNPTIRIELGGHTDNQGSKAHNLTLSQNRAKAVTNYLVEKGISADRLIAKGYGDANPISSNDTEQGRSENRRTEYRILSK